MTTSNPKIYTGYGSAVDNYNKPKKALQAIVQGSRDKSNWGLFDKNNKQHKTILSLIQQLQWVVPSEKWGQVADINRLSNFLKSEKAPVKKPLKDMKPEEVSKIIECFKSMIIKNYK